VALWVVALLALAAALAALSSARRAARRLDSLSQSYWELRYDYTRLRSQVARFDPDQAEDAHDAHGAHNSAQAPTVSFVPLSSMRKKSDGA
jgi:acyl carrier protein phosphodiesterase